MKTDNETLVEPAPKKLSVFEILRRRFPENEYALMKEVRDMAGFNASRSADYIAVNLWPSRGLAINGIELKSFRSDWLSELKKPDKAENIFKHCDYFWLLTTDDSIARMEEIPMTWGWLSIKNEKIFVKKEAPNLEPIPITRNFLCSMLKRAVDKSDFVHIDAIQSRINEAKESAENANAYKLDRALKECAELNKILSDFSRFSGIDLRARTWDKENIQKIGQAVKFIQDGGVAEIKKDLLNLEVKAKNVVRQITEALKMPDANQLPDPSEEGYTEDFKRY